MYNLLKSSLFIFWSCVLYKQNCFFLTTVVSTKYGLTTTETLLTLHVRNPLWISFGPEQGPLMPILGPCPLSLHVWCEQSLLAPQSLSDQFVVAV